MFTTAQAHCDSNNIIATNIIAIYNIRTVLG